MRCLYCPNSKTEVTNSRIIKGGLITWRRRLCTSCHRIFTTKESPIADNLFIIKRNASRQRFSYEKLFVSVFAVLNHRKGTDNGDNAKQAQKISQAIIAKIYALPNLNKDLSSSTLIMLAYNSLKKIGAGHASHYIHYSKYRLETAIKSGVVILRGAD